MPFFLQQLQNNVAIKAHAKPPKDKDATKRDGLMDTAMLKRLEQDLNKSENPR